MYWLVKFIIRRHAHIIGPYTIKEDSLAISYDEKMLIFIVKNNKVVLAGVHTAEKNILMVDNQLYKVIYYIPGYAVIYNCTRHNGQRKWYVSVYNDDNYVLVMSYVK